MSFKIHHQRFEVPECKGTQEHVGSFVSEARMEQDELSEAIANWICE